MEGKTSHDDYWQTKLERILKCLERTDATIVQELYERLRLDDPSLTRSEFTDLIWRLSKEDKIILEDIAPATRSVRLFLCSYDRLLRLYICLGLASGAILSIYGLPADFPWIVIRWLLGSVFLVFIPGYVAVESLFPGRRELDPLERVVLSIGLSLAILMFVGIFLNYTPWGIRLNPTVISLTFLTIALAIVALFRDFSVWASGAETRRLLSRMTQSRAPKGI